MTPLEAQQLLGALGIPIVAALVEGIYAAFPQLSKGSRVICSVVVGVCFALLVALSIDGSLRLATLNGLMIGLASANPRAVVQWTERTNDSPGGRSGEPPSN